MGKNKNKKKRKKGKSYQELLQQMGQNEEPQSKRQKLDNEASEKDDPDQGKYVICDCLGGHCESPKESTFRSQSK